MVAATALLLLQLDVIRHSFIQGALFALSGAVILAVTVPAIEALEVMLSMNAIAVPLILMILTLGLTNAHLAFISGTTGRAVPLLLVLGGVAVLSVAALDAGFDGERPKPNSLNYIADIDENEAWWYSLDRQPDDWTRRYLGQEPVQATLPEWAPQNPFGFRNTPWVRKVRAVLNTAPNAEVLEETVSGDERRLRLRLSSPAGAYATVIRFIGDADVRDLRIDGRLAPPRDAGTAGGNEQIAWFGMPGQGVELEVTASNSAPLGLYLRSNIPGLPPPDHEGDISRPEHMMTAGGHWTDVTQVQRHLEL